MNIPVRRWASRIGTWYRRDATHAVSMAMVRSLGRLVLAATLARTASAEAFAGFIVLAAVETIVLSSIAARFAAPAASLVPGRSAAEQRAVLGRSIADQSRAGRIAALLIAAAAPALHRIGVTPIDAVACALAVATTASHLAVRSAGLCLFRARGLVVGELLVAVGAVAGAIIVGGVLEHAVAGAWLGMAAGAVAAAALTRRRIADRLDRPPARRATDPVAARIAALGRPMLAGSIAYSAGGRLQPMIVAAVLDLAGVAALGIAATFAGPLRMATGAVASILHPRVAQRAVSGTVDSRRRFDGLVLGILAGAGAVATLLVALVARPTIEIVFGVAYVAAAPLAVWACAHAGLAAVASARTAMLQGRGDARTPTVARILATLVTLGLTGPALVRLGAVGALVALVAGEVVFLGFTIWIGRSATRRVVVPLVDREATSDGRGVQVPAEA